MCVQGETILPVEGAKAPQLVARAESAATATIVRIMMKEFTMEMAVEGEWGGGGNYNDMCSYNVQQDVVWSIVL